jgi:hypothetical protein
LHADLGSGSIGRSTSHAALWLQRLTLQSRTHVRLQEFPAIQLVRDRLCLPHRGIGLDDSLFWRHYFWLSDSGSLRTLQVPRILTGSTHRQH